MVSDWLVGWLDGRLISSDKLMNEREWFRVSLPLSLSALHGNADKSLTSVHLYFA